MADTVNPPCKRGETYYGPNVTIDTNNYGTSVDLEGRVANFDDISPSDRMVRRSNRQVTCAFVRNVSGVTLLGKRLVYWAAGYRGKRVGGYGYLTAQEQAGVSDEFLPASGCRNGDMLWIAIAGPSLVKTDLAGADNNVISEGGILYALTAVTSGATTSGRVQPWAGTATSTATTTGDLSKIHFNFIGRAMSAKTTANTNADVLVDLEICKKAA